MRAQQAFTVHHVERVLHRARRMRFRNIECAEVVEVVLDLRPFDDFEAHLAEDFGNALDRAGDRMQAPDGLAAAGERDVDPRWEERRGGQEGGSTCRFRWVAYH